MDLPTLQKLVQILQSYNTWKGSAHPTENCRNRQILQRMVWIGPPYRNWYKSSNLTTHGRDRPTLQKIVEIVKSYNAWYGSAHPTEIGTNPPILQHMYNPVIQVVGIGRHCTVHTVHVLYILNGNINTVHRKQI